MQRVEALEASGYPTSSSIALCNSFGVMAAPSVANHAIHNTVRSTSRASPHLHASPWPSLRCTTMLMLPRAAKTKQ
jgi:hypothetical protein